MNTFLNIALLCECIVTQQIYSKVENTSYDFKVIIQK